MKINLYKIGFFIILCLPLVALPPYFFQPDWAKSIIFRSVVAVLFSLYIWKIDDSLNFLIKSFKKSAILWGLATLFLMFFLASIFSIDRLFSFWGSPYRGGGSITFFFLFIFSILLFVKLKKNDWRSAFILCVIIGVLVSLIALIQFYKIPNPIFSHTLAPSATIGNPITLGIYLSILFFIALSFLFVEKNIKWKIFFSVSLFIFANAIFITSSRAAFL